jgi:hypothetical protein
VAVAFKARVAGTVVGEAGMRVGGSVAGSVVFVGRGPAVGAATVTDISHARDRITNRERNSEILFRIEVYIVEFPFILDHIHEE